MQVDKGGLCGRVCNYVCTVKHLLGCSCVVGWVGGGGVLLGVGWH